MNEDGAVIGGGGAGREVVVYVLWGRVGRWWRWKSNICGGFEEVYHAEIGDGDEGGAKNGV